MNTLHLTYAVEVERCGSITQAAENLYMAQPNLSKAIKELEESMGFAIFSRTSRGVLPTARGKKFLVYARAILAEEKKMETLRAREAADLRLAVMLPGGGAADACLARLMETLDPSQPIELRVREGDARQTVSAVGDGLFPLGVLRLPADAQPPDALRGRGLKWEPLRDYDAVLLFSARHPLADAAAVSPEDLSPYPPLTGAADSPARENSLHIEGRLRQLDALRLIPGAYLWSPPETDDILRRWALTQRACPGAPRFQEGLIYPVDHDFSPLEKRFIALLRAA